MCEALLLSLLPVDLGPLRLPVADVTEGVRRRVDGPAWEVLTCRDASVTDEGAMGGRRSGFWAVADLSGHFVVAVVAVAACPAFVWVDAARRGPAFEGD